LILCFAGGLQRRAKIDNEPPVLAFARFLVGLSKQRGWVSRGKDTGQRVISLIHPDNVPSRRVAEKNGMKIEKKTVFRGFPTLVFAITREQWLAEDGA
jgi:hypothetical protein